MPEDPDHEPGERRSPTEQEIDLRRERLREAGLPADGDAFTRPGGSDAERAREELDAERADADEPRS